MRFMFCGCGGGLGSEGRHGTRIMTDTSSGKVRDGSSSGPGSEKSVSKARRADE